MSRPKKYRRPRDAVMLRLDQDLADRLRAAAAERDLAVNVVASRLLAEGLDRLIPVEELLVTRREAQS